MNRVRVALISIAVIIVFFALYRLLFIRTVNYDIGGVKIPSFYNVLTGKVKPITNYKGPSNLPVVESRKMTEAGLSQEQTIGAEMRWSVFEEWAKTKPEYKGWESDPALFAKAQEDFKKNVEPRTRVVVVK